MTAVSSKFLAYFYTALAEVKRDARLRWGLGAGASVLLSAGFFSMGGNVSLALLHAQAPQGVQLIHQAQGLQVIDMSTSTVSQIIEQLPSARRYELMLYNSGGGEVLKHKGTYTVFVPASPVFDYLPKRYIASLSRQDLYKLALAHMVDKPLPIEESLNGQVPTMGQTLADFEVDAQAQSISVGDAKVLKVYKALNGYVYIINKVLVPQE